MPVHHMEEVVKSIFRQIVQGVCHLHEQGFVHRDLSLENVVVADDGEGGFTARIIDFGAAWAMPLPKHGPAPDEPDCNCSNCPPEVYRREEVADARAIDAWALGVMLFGMLFRQRLYKKPVTGDGMFDAISAGTLPEAIRSSKHLAGLASEQAVDLIHQLLNVDPAARLACGEILGHPWLAEGQDGPVGDGAAEASAGVGGAGVGGGGAFIDGHGAVFLVAGAAMPHTASVERGELADADLSLQP